MISSALRSSRTGRGAPAPAAGGEIFEKGGLACVGADAAQTLLERAPGGKRDGLAGKLGEDAGEALGLGVFDAQRHGSFQASWLSTFCL
jgi:hypothetical protein